MTDSHIMNTYKRLPVTFSHGDGVWLYDTAGKAYLDALCGISVTNLGHNHPKVTQAIHNQAAALLHTSNLYTITGQEKLADKLCSLASMEQAFFGNSGAEANEAALKIARKYGNEKGIKCPTVISFSGSFHGRTMATLSATGNKKIQQGFEPLLEGFITLPFNDLQAVADTDNDQVVAVMVEPVQGEGGINIADQSFLQGLAKLCEERNWLLIFDEIQCGNARCGSYFAFEQYGIKPDIVTLAKGLGNGVPIGACLAAGKACGVLQPGSHGSTFGGNPLAMAAALAVIESIEADQLIANVKQQSEFMQQQFQAALEQNPAITAIRCKGLMIGIELDRPCAELVIQALDQGLLINVTADNVIRLLPPLIIDNTQATKICDTVVTLINAFTTQ